MCDDAIIQSFSKSLMVEWSQLLCSLYWDKIITHACHFQDHKVAHEAVLLFSRWGCSKWQTAPCSSPCRPKHPQILKTGQEKLRYVVTASYNGTYRYVSLTASTGTTIPVSYLHKIKSLQLICRLGTDRCHQGVPGLQMSCRDLITWQSIRKVAQ